VGTIIEFSDLKAPDPLAGQPPWRDSRWLAAAEGWIDAECARAALTRIGQARGRGRPYSVVVRVPTADGTVWFKANPPAARFEPALMVALADWHPDRFAAPIAVDLQRAWSLTRDGGPTLRECGSPSAGSPATSDRWLAVLGGYARLQADLAPHAADLLSLGLADLRPGSVPGQFEKLLGNPHIEAVVGAPDGITRSQHERLRGLGPQLRELCEELDDLGLPASLDHADVHPGNIFAATGSPFDWGDAAVAHPFSSLLVGLRTAVEQVGLSPRSPTVRALAASYLSPWLEAGYGRAAVDRSLSLALRIAPLARALTWGRLFPCYLGHPALAIHAARALAAVLESDPLGVGPLTSGS
jgi:Phosphotransferase enzyme family